MTETSGDTSGANGALTAIEVRALEGARSVLGGARAELAGPRVGAVPLGLGRGAVGPLGGSGGPEGFAIEACRAAAGALGLGGAAAAA